MKLFGTLGLAIIILAPIRTSAVSGWAQYQHDAAHTGRTNASIDSQALSLLRTIPNYTAPLVVGDTLYGTSPFGNSTTVTAFSLSTGETKWSYTGDNLYIAHPAIGGDIVAILGWDFDVNSNALTILDAATGTLRYTLNVGGQFAFIAPTLFRDPVAGSVIAYCAGSDVVSAVQLGKTRGRILWSQSGEFGGDSFPTVVGDSIILAGPGQYYAFERATGSPNHFHQGDIQGGGGVAVAFDANRSQFYVQEAYDGESFGTLTAYHYTDNQNIELVWQKHGNIFLLEAGSVAIGPTGNVYSVTPNEIVEIDPDTGATLRRLYGSFATNVTPAVTRGLLWLFSQTQTLSYDLNTFRLTRAFEGSRGDANTPYSSPGAFEEGFFVLDRGDKLDIYQESP